MNSLLVPFRRRGLRVLASSIALLLAGAVSHAQEVWISPVTGNWSADGNWLDGTAPFGGGIPTLSLQFTGDGFSTITATNNGYSTFSLNKLILDYDGGAIFTIASSTGGNLQLIGNSPSISQVGIGPVTISSPIRLAPNGGGNVTIDGAGINDLIFAGAIGQPSPAGLLINVAATSPNASIIRFDALNTFSGGVRLVAGNLGINNSGALGSGTLRVQGGTVRMLTGGLSIANSIALEGDLVITSANDSTLGGIISSTVAGTGLTLRTNTNFPTLTLTAASTYSGATIIDYGPTSTGPYLTAGTLKLVGSATVLNSSRYDIRAGGTLQIELVNSATNRLGDTSPVILRGGTLSLDAAGVTTAASAEAFGALSTAGYSTVVVTPSVSTNARLVSSSLSRLDRGTLLFRGTNLGRPAAANVASILFTTAPAGLVGAGGSGTEQSILPYAIGVPSTTGNAYSLVTYDAVAGIRPLAAGEYLESLTAALPTSNVLIAGNATQAGGVTMNSLFFSGLNIGGEGRLTIASGALLSTGSGALIASPVDFGNAEGNIFAVANLTISGDLTGSNGLTKSAPGTLTLRGGKSFTGPLTINGGRVAFSEAAELGADAGAITFNGVGAGLLFQGAAPVSLARAVEISSGFATIESTATGGAVLEMSGPISGSGGLRLQAAASGTIRLLGANTFTGPLFLTGGTAELTPAALGTGTNALALSLNTTLRTLGPLTSAREVRVLGDATIDTAGNDVTLSGLIIGSSFLTKRGAGTLTLTEASPFVGGIAISGGTVRLAGAGQLRAPYSISAGGRLLLDQSTTPLPSRIDNDGGVTLNGGEFAIAGNSATSTRELIGTLTLGGFGSSITLTAPGTSSIVVTAKNFTRNNGDMLVRGTNLGGPAGAAFTRLTIPTTAPASALGLLSFVYAASSETGGESFATYNFGSDASGFIGVKPLATYVNASVLQNPSVAPTADVLLAAGSSVLGARNRVQSITFQPDATLALGAGQTLTVGSGRLLVRSGGGPAVVSGGGTIDFGTNAGLIATFGILDFDGVFTGTAGWSKTGTGTLMLSSPALPGPTVTVLAGSLRASPDVLRNTVLTLTAPGRFDLHGAAASVGADIEGTLGGNPNGYTVNVYSGGLLTGSTTMPGRMIQVFGTLAPGRDIGTMTTGDLIFSGNATLALAFASATDYDRLSVFGAATLAGLVNLTLDFRFDPLDDVDRFLILENDGTEAISATYPTGRFRYAGNDLDQDEAFSVGAQQFRLSYTGGDGNDVVLIATPEPGSLALLLLGGGVLAGRRRHGTGALFSTGKSRRASRA